MTQMSRIYHDTTAVLRFYGRHEVIVMGDGPIQVMMPGAVITLADRRAARMMLKAFVEADVLAQRLLIPTDQPTTGLYLRSYPTVYTAVRISGWRPEPTIIGKAPRQSPSKRGQIMVRLRSMTIVCDDLLAVRDQLAGWRQAYDVAFHAWGGLHPADTAVGVWEQRAKERMLQQPDR